MIILARFQHTFRERMPEWIQASALTCWGAIVLQSVALFERPFFHPLGRIMPQQCWGWMALIVGILRIVCLIRNGGWRPSAHLRAMGCFFGAFVWGQLLIGALGVDWLSPAAATYAAFMVMDGLSAYFASGDARAADSAARERRFAAHGNG